MRRREKDTTANGSTTGVRSRRGLGLRRSAVELPARLLGSIVTQPAPGWTPTSAWNAPLIVARFPTLIAGGDFIVGETSTLGTVAEVGATAYDDHAVGEHEPARVVEHPRRCLADGTLIAGLGGHLVDEGDEHPRLEVCVYRYRHLPEGLQAAIDERSARRRRRRGREQQEPAPQIRWASDWFLGDGTCITDLLAVDSDSHQDSRG